ncbi:16S rRNA (cytidine(1402)-2'-O)-methyltransferase [Lacticigenium naphthae]|uniref:16S rRNA (cytidine(1402)-2'-O)-methyltransferase n=1 Tax=Lacticigenium naphthae TaxID=515351 RepID=UPI000407896E|nr:16S rRNA (cytidine(1402)-2'-O)-methyltransferase [Lacticigenium naphthae]
MLSQKSFEANQSNGSLYLVPTPIGNLEDMTFRAVRILKEVDLIASEDTRQTQKLLNHFSITTKQISFHEHNTQERIGQLIRQLEEGRSIAQVSDAGMPSISDPGFELTKAAIEKGIAVVPLPGASAGVTALVASGLEPQPFYFHGFLPRKKKELKSELEKLDKRQETIILYEAPHRLKAVMQAIENVMGTERKIVLARELTKRYEEFLRGNAEEINEWINSNQPRGEFCILIEGSKEAPKTETPDWTDWTLEEHVKLLMQQDSLTSKEAIKKVAQLRDIQKREVYAAYHGLLD